MRVRISRKVALATVSLATVLYGAKAAGLGPGDALLAEILANTSKQLTTMLQSLSELRKSYAEVKRVAEYADDAATAARSFRQFSGRRFGEQFQVDLDAAYPDLERFRQEALAASGVGAGPWAKGTRTLQQLSRYCLSDSSGGKPACVQLRSELDNSRVLSALAQTFAPGSGAAQAQAVDAETAAVIRAGAAQARAADLQKARVRELLQRCNGAANEGSFGGTREAKRFAEECQLAAQQAQLLHLEEGQETNVKLAEIARLHALGIEQKNADLKRELAEQEARRAALTSGLETLVGDRITIRSGGVRP